MSIFAAVKPALGKPKAAALAVLMLAGSASASMASPVDLSSWLIDGGGSWNLQSGNNSVLQTLNSAPTMFFNNQDSQGLALSGTIKISTGSGDDDFVGFVLGYQDDELTSSTADYILVDWKKGLQSGQSPGMNMSHVTGAINTCGTCTSSDAWTHTGNVTWLAGAATLGSTGWVENQSYLFDIAFTSSLITVSVDGVQQFSQAGTFGNGSFGFYNFSQPQVLYAGIQEDVLPDPDPNRVPEPATLGLFLAGCAGIGLAATRRRHRRG